MGSGNNKTVAVSIASALCVILAWVIKEKVGIEVPGDVQSAFQGILAILVVWIVPHSNGNGTTN